MWKTIWLSAGRERQHASPATSSASTPSATSIGYCGIAGVLMDGGSHDNIIGLPTLAGRNVIGNVSEGIDLYGTGTDRNVFRNNLIGVSPDGAHGLRRRRQRHRPQLRARRTTSSAASAPLERNVIAGAGNDGVEFSHGWNQAFAPRQDTSLPYQINDNQVLGNYIGFKPDGSYDPRSPTATASRAARPTTTARASTSSTARTARSSTATGSTACAAASGRPRPGRPATSSATTHRHRAERRQRLDQPLRRLAALGRQGQQVINNKIANTGWAGIGLDAPVGLRQPDLA